MGRLGIAVAFDYRATEPSPNSKAQSVTWGWHRSLDHQGELSDSEIASLSGSSLVDSSRLVRPLINQVW